jgi:hypothetical protein
MSYLTVEEYNTHLVDNQQQINIIDYVKEMQIIEKYFNIFL